MQTTHEEAIGLGVALNDERTRLLAEVADGWNRHWARDDRGRQSVTYEPAIRRYRIVTTETTHVHKTTGNTKAHGWHSGCGCAFRFPDRRTVHGRD